MTGKNRNDPPANRRPLHEKAAAGAPSDKDAQEPSTLEAFDEEGAGIAAKE